jgi:MAGUK p55 subfamily protein 5
LFEFFPRFVPAQYYGTSLDAVRTVINSGKICVLNLQPASLPILHDSDLKPYVVFLSPPSLQMYRQQRQKHGEMIKVKDLSSWNDCETRTE